MATTTTPKTFTIVKTRKGVETPTTGTLEELTTYYRNTLVNGNSYNPKISLKPRSIKGLLNALDKCVDVLQRGSYNPNSYHLGE